MSIAAAPILLDNVECRGADRFEDCIQRGWGVHDCSSTESVGLICNPGTDGNVHSIQYCILIDKILKSAKPHINITNIFMCFIRFIHT